MFREVYASQLLDISSMWFLLTVGTWPHYSCSIISRLDAGGPVPLPSQFSNYSSITETDRASWHVCSHGVSHHDNRPQIKQQLTSISSVCSVSIFSCIECVPDYSSLFWCGCFFFHRCQMHVEKVGEYSQFPADLGNIVF